MTDEQKKFVETLERHIRLSSAPLKQELIERLIPLFELVEAGQEMRDGYDSLWADLHANDTNPSDPKSVVAWDAAWAKFKAS
jgi:hypothetical protein